MEEHKEENKEENKMPKEDEMPKTGRAALHRRKIGILLESYLKQLTLAEQMKELNYLINFLKKIEKTSIFNSIEDNSILNSIQKSIIISTESIYNPDLNLFLIKLKLYLKPLTLEEQKQEISFIISNVLEAKKDDIKRKIESKKKAEKEAETSILKSIKTAINSENSSFAKFDDFLKNKSNGGYKKSIITRKKHKKNNKSFRRKSNKNC